MRKIYTFLLAIACLFLTAHVEAQNSALKLTGTSYVTAGVDALDPNGDFTIEFWTYIPAAGPDGQIHEFVSEGATGSGFYIGYDGSGNILVGDFWGPTGVPMPFGTWTHIALTFDNSTSTTTLYVNGVFQTNTNNFFFTDDQPFRIGVQTDISQLFTGEIDEVKAWGTPRTAAQVRADMFTAPDLTDVNLNAYFNMNDGSGTTVTNEAASTGVSQNGSITGDNGANSWATSPVETNSNALTFDGVDDQVVIPASGNYDLPDNTGGTVEFWVNPATVSSSFSTLLGNRGPGGVRYSYHLSSTQVGIDAGAGTVNAINLPDTLTTTGVWHHMAFVYDGTNTNVYINGMLLGTIPGAYGPASSQPLTIGAANTPTVGANETFFNGSIDEVRVWNTQRSQAEILANMGNTLNGSGAGLVAQFSFDEGLADADNTGLTTTLDNTAFGNNGALRNFALSGTSSNFNLHTLNAIPLPLTLTAFTATRSKDQSVLQWQTAQEENTSSFSIERSTDGLSYTSIGTIAAAGNSTSTRSYEFTDRSPQPNDNYYRLKQIDLDGHFTYSAVRLVSFPVSGNKLLWYATGQNTVEVYLQQGNNEVYTLSDVGGHILRLGQLSGGKTQVSGLPAGIYFVRIGTLTTEIFLN